MKLRKAKSDSSPIDWIFCDLADFASVRKCAQTFQKKHRVLDFFITNAGIYLSEQYTETKDGFEEQIQVNFLGHYLLFKLLLDPLKNANVKQNIPGNSHLFCFAQVISMIFRSIL